MNKIFILAFVAVFALGANKLSAQSFKFGHINSQELLVAMPEADSAQKKVEAYGKELQATIDGMRDEYTKKVKDYQEKEATLTPPAKEARQKDIQEMAQRIQEQMAGAQENFNKENQKQMELVYTKARQAITKVAKDNAFTYIFDTSPLSGGTVVYFNEAQSTDILPLVKKELKITK